MTSDLSGSVDASDDADPSGVRDGSARYHASPALDVVSGPDREIDEALVAIARSAGGTGEVARETILARLELAAALAGALAHLAEPAVMEDDNTMNKDSPQMPGTEEVRQAVATLLAFSDTSLRTEWRLVVDTLVACPSLDADQLYQAQRHAERRRRLLSELTLLGASEFARLLPDRIELGRNAARTLTRLRTEHRLLAVRVRGDWKYPIAQIDSSGDVHAALPPLLSEASAAGYDSWEILHWLTTPLDEPCESVPGRALPGIDPSDTAENIALAAVARHDTDAPPSAPAPTPIRLLERGDEIAFERAVKRWLG